MTKSVLSASGDRTVQAEPPTQTAAESVPEPPLIAVVDDDLSFRTALGRLLRLWGFRFEGFHSAEAFLERASRAHCVVLDLHLGGMSGLELQARIAQEDRKLPIVFVTATEDSSLRRRALAGGAAGYLQKPFDDSRLLEVLYQAVDYRTD
jgi:FixJ family two-component response regulator